MNQERGRSERERALRGYLLTFGIASVVGLVLQIFIAAFLTVAPAWMERTSVLWLAVVPLVLTLLSLRLLRWAVRFRSEANRELTGHPVCVVASLVTAACAGCTGAAPAALVATAALLVTARGTTGTTLKRDVQRMALVILAASATLMGMLGSVAIWRGWLQQDRGAFDPWPYLGMPWAYWVPWGLIALSGLVVLVGYVRVVWRARAALRRVAWSKPPLVMLGVAATAFTYPFGAVVSVPLTVAVLLWPKVPKSEQIEPIPWLSEDDAAWVDDELAR